MTRGARRPILLDVLLYGLVGALLAVAARQVWAAVDDDPGPERAQVADGAISVNDATLLGSRVEDVAVTGFVFVGKERVILCAGRDREDPPYCTEPAIDLLDLDTSRLDLVVPDGAPAYSRDEVTVLGRYRFLTLQVDEIVQ